MAYKNKKKTSRVLTWWLQEDEDQMASDIYDTVCYIHEDQSDRREKNLRCMRLYGNMDFAGIGPYSYARTQTPNLPENRVKYNVIASATDTLASKVSKMRPKVSFLTSGGDFSLQEEGKKLTKFVMGSFKGTGVYSAHQMMFRDGLVCDLGAVKNYRIGNKIFCERTLPNELYTDTADGMYGSPRNLYQVKFVYKDTLIGQYPEKAALIKMSTGVLSTDSSNTVNNKVEEESDYVIVIESWHLPSEEDAGDGKHVISVQQGTLLTEEYKRDYFPFTFSRWSNGMVGFYGQSLADRLTGNQVEINKMLRIIQRSFHLGSAFKVFLEYGSKVAKEHINNEIGSIVYYSGVKPEFYTPKTVHEEFFRHLEWLIRSSFEDAGISQLSATSKLPPGLDGGSGKAIREYNDLETERFVLVAQQYEASFLETARQQIDLAKDIADDDLDFEVVAESKRFVDSIKWSDINLKDNEYILQMFPTSMLPNDPAGRMATVQEWVNAGWIDRAYGMKLLEFPDLEGYMSLETAAIDDLFDTADQMLYHGKAMTPEPFQDLQQGLKMFQSIYLWAKRNGAPDSRLELLRTWMTQAQAMLSASSNATAMGQGMPPQADATQMGGAAMQPPAQGSAPANINISTGAAPQAA